MSGSLDTRKGQENMKSQHVLDDELDLERFVDAQRISYDDAFHEVASGKKKTHWMWYIFPQIKGLGVTSISQKYAIKDLAEARAFYEHPYLGKNLRDITAVLLTLQTDDAYGIFGSPDHLKLRSCMTLFSVAVPEEPLFLQVLDKYYGGRKDEKTLEILKNKE